MRLVCLVEGQGEVGAYRCSFAVSHPNVVAKTVRVKKDRFLKPGQVEHEPAVAGELAGEGGAILILLDADKDCPAKLGPAIEERARKARSDRPVLVALAKAEFECWFLAAAVSLRGKRGLPPGLDPPTDPESVRGAKEWIKSRAGRYSPAGDQPAFAQIFDCEEARRNSPSFARFERRLRELTALPDPPPMQ